MRRRTILIGLNKLIFQLCLHWQLIANSLFVLVLGLAVLAPALMTWGFPQAGNSLYRFFAPHDHQLPDRSYFLFGQTAAVGSYSREQVLGWGADAQNLRAFTGNRRIGFKMALNHRMTAIFLGLLIGGLAWSAFPAFKPKITRVKLGLMILPMLADALSHMADERAGSVFRLGNWWAIWLSGNVFPAQFYSGDTMGSLNWGLRTLTGLLFGLGTAWYLGGYLAAQFTDIRAQVEPRLRRLC